MESLDEWFRWVVGGLVAGGVWLLRLINSKASKDELRAAIERVDRHYEEGRESRDKLYNRINDIAESVAYLRGSGGKDP